jgi:hypothetical protein
VRLAAHARSTPQRPLASLFDEIYRPAAQPLMRDSVADALLSLAQARERYRLEHAMARSSIARPTAEPPETSRQALMAVLPL